MKSTPIIHSLNTEFYDAVEPALFPKSELRWYNDRAAQELGLEHLTANEILDHFCFFKPFKGNIKKPLALRYHGHQFRHYNPDLGDGRGFLFAQFASQNKIYDLSTKGSGTTPYSRGGDGRLTLKGAVREILATELLESLGVNTSRTLAVFETGEELQRGDEPSPARSAVLTRRVHSSIRFGTFQRFAYLNQTTELEMLVDYCLENYFSDLQIRPGQKVQLFFQSVMRKTADLAAQLMTAGFVHAVLNTDNMNITGEVFDFGPYRFLPFYNPFFTAAYFDQRGLYCYGRQPESFLWGLEQLGQALKQIQPNLSIESVLKDFEKELTIQHKKHFFRRLNLVPQFSDVDDVVIQNFYEMLSQTTLGFEKCFFDFFGGFDRQAWKLNRPPYENAASIKLIESLKPYKVAQAQTLMHPYFLEKNPTTLLIQDIEALWQPIFLRNDWSLFNEKIQALRAFRGVYSSPSPLTRRKVF